MKSPIRSPFKRVQQWLVFGRQWWLMDAKGQDIDQLSEKVARHLKGQHKPIWHPETDCGDHVIVYNCKEVSMRAFDWKRRGYIFWRGYPRSKANLEAWQIHAQDPRRVVFMSVYEKLGSILTRRLFMERLHLITDENIPEHLLKNVSDQMEQVQTVPKAYHEYSQEERDSFPSVFDWPDTRLIEPAENKP